MAHGSLAAIFLKEQTLPSVFRTLFIKETLNLITNQAKFMEKQRNEVIIRRKLVMGRM